MINDEIKEILDDLKNTGYEKLAKNIENIIDYITNLQEQLHQASLDIQELTERDIECPSWCDKLTNLQQENERLNKENEKWFAVAKDFEMEAHDLWNKNNELEEAQKNFEKQFIKEMDYKSRIEKAVEYIGQYDGHIEGYYYSKEHKRFLVEENVKNELLNILNGKEKEK